MPKLKKTYDAVLFTKLESSLRLALYAAAQDEGIAVNAMVRRAIRNEIDRVPPNVMLDGARSNRSIATDNSAANKVTYRLTDTDNGPGGRRV